MKSKEFANNVRSLRNLQSLKSNLIKFKSLSLFSTCLFLDIPIHEILAITLRNTNTHTNTHTPILTPNTLTSIHTQIHTKTHTLTYIHARMHACMLARTHAHMHACTHARTHTHPHTHTYTQTNSRTYTIVRIRIFEKFEKLKILSLSSES